MENKAQTQSHAHSLNNSRNDRREGERSQEHLSVESITTDLKDRATRIASDTGDQIKGSYDEVLSWVQGF